MKKSTPVRVVVRVGRSVLVPRDEARKVKCLVGMNGKLFRKKGTSVEDLSLAFFQSDAPGIARDIWMKHRGW